MDSGTTEEAAAALALRCGRVLGSRAGGDQRQRGDEHETSQSALLNLECSFWSIYVGASRPVHGRLAVRGLRLQPERE